MKRGWIILTVISLGLVGLWAEDDVARGLLSKGDEILKKGEPERALELYQKALKEAPNLPEVHFKIGEVLLKLDKRIQARLALKKCISLIDATEKPTTALKDLRKKAEQSLDNVDASRKEGKTIEQEYIKQLLAFARQVKLKDNQLAEDVLNRILLL